MRCFMGILTPPDISLAVEEARTWMKSRWGCRSGMGTAPHITLIPPFPQVSGFPEPREEDLRAFTQDMNRRLSSSGQLPLELTLEGTGHFGSRTVFFAVNPEKGLMALQAALEAGVLERWPGVLGKSTFHPHLTVANRDIPAGALKPSLEWLSGKAPHRRFSCTAVSLFLWREGRWQVSPV